MTLSLRLSDVITVKCLVFTKILLIKVEKLSGIKYISPLFCSLFFYCCLIMRIISENSHARELAVTL